MSLMEDDLKSSSSRKNEIMTVLTKNHPTIGVVLKNTYKLIYNTYM